MNNTFEGFVEFLTPATDVSKSDKPFHVAELGLRMETPVNGRIMKDYVGFQFTQDGARAIQELNQNDQIRVQFGIRGNMTDNKDKQGTEKNPLSKKIFVSLEGYRFDIIARAGQQAPPADVTPNAATESKVTSNEKKTEANSGAQPVQDDDLPF